jgi:hypothetical protein
MTQAQKTSTAWSDFAMRPNTTSAEGQVPITGDSRVSPDIIPMRVPVQDPQAVFATPQSWSNGYPAPVILDTPNYIYVRARNFYSGAETGAIRLYAAPSALINWPSIWLSDPLQVQNQPDPWVNISAAASQEIVVGAQPFYWQTPQPPQGSSSYSLFALVDTPHTPNPLLHGDIPGDYRTLAGLFADSLNIACKDSVYVPGDSPTWTQKLTLDIPASASNGALLHIYVFATAGCVNGQVAVSSGDSQGFNPVIEINRTTITGPEETYGILTMPAPGVASTVLNISFWIGSSNPGPGDRIVVSANWVPDSAEEARPFIESGVARPLPPALATGTMSWEVPVGSVSYHFTGSP